MMIQTKYMYIYIQTSKPASNFFMNLKNVQMECMEANRSKFEINPL
jgi:hypothetical protein